MNKKKGLLIGLVAGAIVGIGAIVKYLNDEREEVETGEVKDNGDGTCAIETRTETVKDVVKRKVNEGLEWVSKNPEKVAAATTVVGGIATGISTLAGIAELYSYIKGARDKTNESILKELESINKKLDEAANNPCLFY